MLAHDDPLTRLQVQRDDVAGRVAAERDLTGRLRLEHQQRHPAEHAALESLAQRVQADLELRVLPQQHVVLEVNGHLPIEGHVQDRDELAFEPVGDPGSCSLLDLSRKDLGGGRHLLSPFGDVVRQPQAAALDFAEGRYRAWPPVGKGAGAPPGRTHAALAGTTAGARAAGPRLVEIHDDQRR